MASISSLGIGANLPLDTLLTNLTTAEKARLTPITQQQSANTARLTAYGTLKSALEKFQTANATLNNADVFKSTTASSSSADLTVSTSAGAAPGRYTISVTQLAQAQSLTTTKDIASSKTAQGDTSVTERKLVINQQPGREKPLEITLTSEQTSLEGMRDAINNADSGVSASIVKLKDEKYQLVLTSTDSGLDNKMTVSVEGDDTLNAVIGYDGTEKAGGIKQLVEAKNALLTVNNIAIERGSNTITDAPEGVTLTLSKEVSNVTVSVQKSNEQSKAAIKGWVDAYNSLIDTFNSLTKYTAVDAGADAQDNSNGALLGDTVVRSIQTGLRGLFTQGDGASAYKTLTEIGITSDGATGKLKIDDTKLNKALTENSSSVRLLLVGDGKETGITTKMASNIKEYLADDGIIDSAQDSINATLKKLTKQYLATSESIDATVARYKAQFTQLDTMMSKLNSTSSYLSQQFTAMSNSSS
ncbi:flagellar filament capping protein FliD [Atlantibacter subterranea]|uniref:flagellar filament capping protein FliD n=1 Tax=Atlantibacter subterraneus TaxID=255519 RepID=UPI0020C490B8|nr:flagellar filament capping protein FliD [Atlantibacter subterranea]UTJ45857.1 flagellar filament capping protein FliD [Atlantibacter subterranea]